MALKAATSSDSRKIMLLSFINKMSDGKMRTLRASNGVGMLMGIGCCGDGAWSNGDVILPLHRRRRI